MPKDIVAAVLAWANVCFLVFSRQGLLPLDWHLVVLLTLLVNILVLGLFVCPAGGTHTSGSKEYALQTLQQKYFVSTLLIVCISAVASFYWGMQTANLTLKRDSCFAKHSRLEFSGGVPAWVGQARRDATHPIGP